MKAEERKALVTNDLAKGLEQAYEGAAQLPKTGLYWALGAVAVVIALLLFRYLMWTGEVASSERWVSLDETVFSEQIAIVDKDGKLKDTPQGRLLEFKDARLNLAEGVRLLGVNRGGAITRLQSAVDKYEELLRAAGRVPLLQQEALWGAAKANEALGNISKAKEWYGKLAADYKTPLGADAKKALERLEASTDLRELVKEFTPEAAGRRN
ncbi:MAG: hypothetical protein EBV06_11780 [Planctomycetia bacterium]|nr:hypothetical protein [Planctomycetia bacterium]